MTLFLDPSRNLRYGFARVRTANSLATLEAVEKAYKKIEPNLNFYGSYLDENIERTLRRESNMITLISSGSILAIILSSMGLFAMSLIIAAQRKKEIGIRKVVGAGRSSLALLLTKDFIILVAIAFVLATPLAWWASNNWLANYPYRIDLNIWMFLASGLIALAIAGFTISFKTIQAASINPIKNLRTE
jgi:ABC-type antimicrobial peptide transport system permease subunit